MGVCAEGTEGTQLESLLLTESVKQHFATFVIFPCPSALIPMLGRICVFELSGVSVAPYMESILKVASCVFLALFVIEPDQAKIGTKSSAEKQLGAKSSSKSSLCGQYLTSDGVARVPRRPAPYPQFQCLNGGNQEFCFFGAATSARNNNIEIGGTGRAALPAI